MELMNCYAIFLIIPRFRPTYFKDNALGFYLEENIKSLSYKIYEGSSFSIYFLLKCFRTQVKTKRKPIAIDTTMPLNKMS